MVFISPIQSKNIRFVLIAFFTASLAIVALMSRWQLFDSERFVAIANSRFQDVKIPSVRGSILAADGSTLAYSEPRYDAFVWVPELEHAEKNGTQTRAELVEKVSKVIEVEPATILEKFNTKALWIKIANKVTNEQKNAILALKTDTNASLKGVQFEYLNKRTYPEGGLASQVLGYVGQYDNEGKGVWGLEQYWDGSLRPIEGIESDELDPFGNPIALAGSDVVESKPGSTVYTTIDKTLQGILEEKLKQGYEEYQAVSMTGIILNPKTGAIMAMANFPNFDPNEYYKVTDGNDFGNKAISTPYEIGSVAKIFTLSAAIDSGKITPDTVILPTGHNGCEIISPDSQPGDKCFVPAEQRKDNRIIDCICTYNRKPVTRTLTALDAIKGSDNIAFRHIALTMSYPEYYDYLVKFGIGKATQVDLAGESYANFKDLSKWNYADQAVYSYGHGYSMTPLQTAMAVAAIANDGKRMQPYIVSKVIDADDKVTEFQPKVVEQVVTPETAKTVGLMLHEVYLGQLIEKQFKPLSRYNIGLKSGTALIPYTDRAGYSSEINATFVGYDASSDGKFLMLIKIEKPGIGDLSYYNARILWLETFDAIKEYLNLRQY